MGVQWTNEQQQVIDTRHRNLLVSAAAGSGKTAVLVERILTMILDPSHPIDVDHLLVVTFTKAAAGEMKERLRLAMEKRLEEEPENEHLQKQTTLVQRAQINTIHGFCSYVIQNYFHKIDLDPGYRTADQGELKLIRAEVMEEILEEAYQEKTPDFIRLVDSYGNGKTDVALEEMIEKLSDFSMSYPWPKEWLLQCVKAYEISTVEELEKTHWFGKMLWEEATRSLKDALLLAEQNQMICREADGPVYYGEAVAEDIATLEALLQIHQYEQMTQALQEVKWKALSRKKDSNASEMRKNQVKDNRDQMKKMITELKTELFYASRTEILEEVKNCAPAVRMCVELTLRFQQRFAEKKEEKNVIDFSDMEHFALRILAEKKDGITVRTDAAKELAQQFEEILIDEYQDSNDVQEMLLTSVSRIADGTPNVFMVGDVKQSIYSFRMARPNLFMEKYKSYGYEDNLYQKIDLHKNFRSRSQVLSSVNYLFEQFMGLEIGGVVYDNNAALYPGAAFPQQENPQDFSTEILAVDLEHLTEEQKGETKETEAMLIAQRIRKMVGREEIVDKKTGEYRTIRYGDIVILLRSMKDWADCFHQVLQSQGIPSYRTSRTGYFSAMEIQTLLNYLKLCDNPKQEIPFAAILTSPIIGASAQMLTALQNAYPDLSFYEKCRNWTASFQTDSDYEQLPQGISKEEAKQLSIQLARFFKTYDSIRRKGHYTPVHEMITLILEETGYGNYVSAMATGEQRSANLRMLVEKALDFEKTSYRGVFHFVRYIESLQKYQMDFGEVNILGEGEDVVRIMSIHKSKGLEFPVVFAAGMGKNFNMQDLNKSMIFHPELGIGAVNVYPEYHIRSQTLLKKLIRMQLLRDTLGEEMRVLYVALTRAKEKLILTGTIASLKDWQKQLLSLEEQRERMLPMFVRMKAKTYWKWILPSMARHPEAEKITGEQVRARGEYPQIQMQIDFPDALLLEETKQMITAAIQKQTLENWDESRIWNSEIHERLQKQLSWRYPYEYLEELPVKLSVSEIKRANQPREDLEWIQVSDVIPLIPEFVQGRKEKAVGAKRGTAYHRMLECLDYEHADSISDLREQLDQMIYDCKLTSLDAESIRLSDLLQFVHSEIGQRMAFACKHHKLFREQPFVLRYPAGFLNQEWKQEEILVQGIIDAWMIEGEELVLVDYKTDEVKDGTGTELVKKYRTQLLQYQNALERLTGKKVKEAYIYSFACGRSLPIS